MCNLQRGRGGGVDKAIGKNLAKSQMGNNSDAPCYTPLLVSLRFSSVVQLLDHLIYTHAVRRKREHFGCSEGGPPLSKRKRARGCKGMSLRADKSCLVRPASTLSQRKTYELLILANFSFCLYPKKVKKDIKFSVLMEIFFSFSSRELR